MRNALRNSACQFLATAFFLFVVCLSSAHATHIGGHVGIFADVADSNPN
jgi:hypothetical protein